MFFFVVSFVSFLSHFSWVCVEPPPPTEVLSGQAGQGSQRPPSPPWLATISLVATEPLEVIHLKPLKAPASGLSASGSCVDNPVGWVDVNGVDCPGYAQYLCLVQAFSSPLKPVSSQLVNLSIFPRLPQCSRGGGQLGQHQPFFPHRTRFRKSGSSLQSYQLWQMAIGHTLRQNFAPEWPVVGGVPQSGYDFSQNAVGGKTALQTCCTCGGGIGLRQITSLCFVLHFVPLVASLGKGFMYFHNNFIFIWRCRKCSCFCQKVLVIGRGDVSGWV